MLFGHNTDVKAGDTVYHVQTEDRGTATPVIDTTVYCRGRVVHRRTNDYNDLLPLDADRENLLRQRIDEQHRSVSEEIRGGTLQLDPPPAPSKETPSAENKTAKGASPSTTEVPALDVELVNAKSWLVGKRANLNVAVRQTQDGQVLPGAFVTVRVDGAADVTQFSSQTGADGQAWLEFDMPKLVGGDSALIIEASRAHAKGLLKFQLKTKPRVPTN